MHAANPQGHWQTTTMISSIRLDGTTACMTIDGATDTEIFRAYVHQVLSPTLRTGDMVILDNLSPHKSDGTLELIRKQGAEVRFLPAYSPDLNPIEMMWSKVKTSLRSAEARTAKALTQAIGTALASITAQDARNWFAHCGYSFISNALTVDYSEGGPISASLALSIAREFIRYAKIRRVVGRTAPAEVVRQQQF